MGARRSGAGAASAVPASGTDTQPVDPVTDPVIDQAVPVDQSRSTQPASTGTSPEEGRTMARKNDEMDPPAESSPAARFVMTLDNSLHDPDGKLKVEGDPESVDGHIVAAAGKRVDVPAGEVDLFNGLQFLTTIGRAQQVAAD